MIPRAALVLLISFLASVGCTSQAAAVDVPGVDLTLATAGTTKYVLVKPASPTEVDEYAVTVLADYLKQITGADFPLVTPAQADADSPAIFIGLSAPAFQRLGPDPLAGLKEQEHVARSVGKDVCLYGKGIHGNLHAVMEFLENSLGWRWYSVFEKAVVPSKPTVMLKPFNRRRGYSFAMREVGLRHSHDFYYQNGMNMGSENWGIRAKPGFVPYLRNDKFVHASFSYIPPKPEAVHHKFKWMERDNYFDTNPDFFSMNVAGRRVADRQLCFGNPGLRQELTRNILKHIAVSPGNDIITLDAWDTTDTFCYCPACRALEKKYGGPCGPIIDYLIEICNLLTKQHAKVFVKTLAYRRSQTQKPPVLPAGEKLPDNLIISFAPIEDCYFADWTHPDPRIQETYSDLVAWSRITKHLWAWLYPNPWGSGQYMPVGNLRRVINNMRLMHKAGVSGVFTDHNGFTSRSGLSELQSYLLYKLMQDVSCDTDALIREFTDHQYGAAAHLVREYLEDLERGREAMAVLPPGVGYESGQRYDDVTFPYLTVENIHRWQLLFDRMVALTAKQADSLLNVQLLRRELDFATLWKWLALRKAHPEYYKDYKVAMDRITAANRAKAPAGMQPAPLGTSVLADFIAVLQGSGQEKPLPPEFSGVDRSRIQVFLPTNTGRQNEPRLIVDPEAARGYAVTVHHPDLPFQLGFYQWLSRNPTKGNHGARLKLGREEIVPGKYRLYKLGTITVTPDCWIWFSAQSWGTHLEIGPRVYEPGAPNLWEAYVSLKCDGPKYGGTAKDDRVLCDRIIVVKKP